jgi:hypothetical protein
MENLMKPFSHRTLNKVEAIYNYRLSRAHRIVENTFGILSSHFSILLREINVSPKKAVTTVLACCYLHNFLRQKRVEPYYQGGFDIEYVNTGEIINTDWRSDRTLIALKPL